MPPPKNLKSDIAHISKHTEPASNPAHHSAGAAHSKNTSACALLSTSRGDAQFLEALAALRENEKHFRLLIAEDSVSNRELLRLFLEHEPYEIVMAETGREALALFSPGAFDVILMDMEMPELDGCAATEAIRRLEATSGTRRTPILMLSAHAIADYEQKGLAAGCDGFMTKPIRKSQLIEVLRRAVGA